MSHLLSLSALHAAAPGVLSVVFGSDGDFEGAPVWRPPLWGTLRPRKGNPPDENDGQTGFVFRYTLNTAMRGNADPAVVMDGPAAIWGIGGAALDCRVPSVAARLAGLCARALDVEATGQAWATEAGEIRPEFWVVRYCDTAGYAASVAWCKATGRPDRRGLSPCPPETPSLPAGLADVPSFLASLTLSLAPRIAALAAR